MADTPQGYQIIPEVEQKKAKAFFDRGKTVADSGQFEYAIEMFLNGLGVDPEAKDAHQTLRDISLRRKVMGGKDLGFMEKMKLKRPTKEDKQNLLNAEKALAYDPGNTDNMVNVLQSALRAGFYDTVMWMGPILQKANADSPKPDVNKFLILKDVYKQLEQWKLAVEACHYATLLRPDDMDLQKELKDLGAHETMTRGKYTGGGSFRDSIRDRDKQMELMDRDKDVHDVGLLEKMLATAEGEYKAEPNEPGKLIKLVDVLKKTEQPERENQAIELLEAAHKRTGQFRWRQQAGDIKLNQLKRMERSIRADLQKNPADEGLKQQYRQFLQEKLQEELTEYTLWSEAYPTEGKFKFDMAMRMFQLQRYDDAIPIFQQVRQDPKFKVDAGIALGCSFLGAGYGDEAVDTLKELIDAYPGRGDAKSIDMFYWYGRSLEQKNDAAASIKAYSQVAQWNFNFRDTQVRIKKLRAAGVVPPPPAPPQQPPTA